MIVEWLIDFVLTVIDAVVSLLPNADVNITNFIVNGLTNFRTLVAGVDWIFPVNTFLLVLTMVLTIEGIILLFKIGKWVAANVSGGFFKH